MAEDYFSQMLMPSEWMSRVFSQKFASLTFYEGPLNIYLTLNFKRAVYFTSLCLLLLNTSQKMFDLEVYTDEENSYTADRLLHTRRNKIRGLENTFSQSLNVHYSLQEQMK